MRACRKRDEKQCPLKELGMIAVHFVHPHFFLWVCRIGCNLWCHRMYPMVPRSTSCVSVRSGKVESLENRVGKGAREPFRKTSFLEADTNSNYDNNNTLFPLTKHSVRVLRVFAEVRHKHSSQQRASECGSKRCKC